MYDYAGSGIIMVPVPYDETSTGMRGSDNGPEAIMEASAKLEFYDVETNTEVHRRGIHTIEPLRIKSSPEELVSEVYSEVIHILKDDKFPVIIGGNHTVSIGSVKAFAEHFRNLTVLQLDAHTDLRQDYEGSPFNHACSMARILEMVPAVQVGIRSISADELPSISSRRVFYSHELYYDKTLYVTAIEKLDRNVYITIDLDVFDPSLIPSTGTPEPGGPDYFEIMHFLREVAKFRNVVGFDIVELCPSEVNKTPDFVAAKIIYQLLSYIFA